MTNKRLCPECKQFLETVNSCPCGWQESKSVSTVKSDPFCKYTAAGNRCQKIGSICPSPYSTSGPWYCIDHWQS
jgi:hypothetical protein